MKKIIGFPYFCSIIGAGSKSDAMALFEQLPEPTLADVYGKRDLEDMLDDEFEELLNIAGLDRRRAEKNNQNAASIFQKYNGKYDNNKVYVNYDCSILEIEPGTIQLEGRYLNPVQVMRWFIDQKFNMYWEDNEDEEETEGE